MAKQIPSLTGIRFIAAASVALAHGGVRFLVGNGPTLDLNIETLAWLGMSIFFTLSGFVIQYNYGTAIADNPQKAIPEFLVARAARIYPLFVVLFLVELLTGPMVWRWLLGITEPAGRFSWHIVPFQLGMVQSWFFANVGGFPPIDQYEPVGVVSWSVSTEWFFYLAFPAVCPFLSRIRSVSGAIICAIGAVTIEMGIDVAVLLLQDSINLLAIHAYGTETALPNWKKSLINWMVYSAPFCRIWEFFLGCSLAKLHELWLAQSSRPSRALLDIAAGIGIVAIVWVFWFAAHKPPFSLQVSLFDIARNNIALAAPVALILIAAAQPDCIAGRLLSVRWLVFLGEASFGLYLIHSTIYQRFPMVRWQTNSELFGHLSALALAFTLAVSIAVLLHFNLEAVARRLIRECYRGSSAEQRGHVIRLSGATFVALIVAAATYATQAATGQTVTEEGISVVAGTYGGNCRSIAVRGNATPALAAVCNGKDECTFKIGMEQIGDPAPGCPKEFTAAWICKGDRMIRSGSVPAQSGFASTLQLSCKH
ncbi:acyltransferase [Bradyrhizobium brasilense]|uniref:acyltransferase family protein n=1 Tax=Bradyrhizobium brasilense TaxID=1419277 RepID=UPI002878014B|nr:acyltransferase family protein [Bradyrhizobium brasilense]MCP3415716.1 acyltransferase [Bradyrhizobium brasilense]